MTRSLVCLALVVVACSCFAAPSDVPRAPMLPSTQPQPLPPRGPNDPPPLGGRGADLAPPLTPAPVPLPPGVVPPAAGGPAPQLAEVAPLKPDEQAAREEAFGKLMSGATLEGQFTARDRADGKMANDKYTLGKVSKVAGEKDLWNFETRIEYGGKDITVPVAVRVVWSGDTPVITLDKLTIPGAGTFTSRVMIFNNQYAGMWDGGGNHGGLMFGKVTPAKGEEKKAEEKK